VLPHHRRHPLDERDGVQISGRHLLFVQCWPEKLTENFLVLPFRGDGLI
jgi:hypothetical protein